MSMLSVQLFASITMKILMIVTFTYLKLVLNAPSSHFIH